jgi:Mor family transcriptional regulator
MMDWQSYSKVYEEIKRVIKQKAPEMDAKVLQSLAGELTGLTQREVYEYSGCKIPFETYIEIRAALSHGVKQKELAEKYNLTATSINKICNDKLIVKKHILWH